MEAGSCHTVHGVPSPDAFPRAEHKIVIPLLVPVIRFSLPFLVINDHVLESTSYNLAETITNGDDVTAVTSSPLVTRYTLLVVSCNKFPVKKSEPA